MLVSVSYFFFFNDTATTEIYTLSLHDALPISSLAKFPLDLLLFFTAVRRLRQGRYHYLHTHEEAGIMGAVLSFIFGCQHLFDMHSDLSLMVAQFPFFKHPILVRYVAAIQKWVLRYTNIA